MASLSGARLVPSDTRRAAVSGLPTMQTAEVSPGPPLLGVGAATQSDELSVRAVSRLRLI